MTGFRVGVGDPIIAARLPTRLPEPITWPLSPVASIRFGSLTTSTHYFRGPYGHQSIAAEPSCCQGLTRTWSRGPCSGTSPPGTDSAVCASA
jgi:hypothetical protein